MLYVHVQWCAGGGVHVCTSRHGKYVYASGSTSVMTESVKRVSDDDDWLIGAEPMLVQPEHV